MPTNAIRDNRPIADRYGRCRAAHPPKTPSNILAARIRILSAALLCLFALGIRAAPAEDNPHDTPGSAAADVPAANGPAGQGAAAQRAAGQGAEIKLPARVETQHSVQTAAGPLDYRAIAEPITLTTPKGEPTASIFTVSYIAEPAAQPRAGQPGAGQPGTDQSGS